MRARVWRREGRGGDGVVDVSSAMLLDGMRSLGRMYRSHHGYEKNGFNYGTVFVSLYTFSSVRN